MKLELTTVCLVVFLGLIFLVLFEVFRINSCRAQTPPGPRPLPFVSYLHLTLKSAIFLNTIELAKEALVQNASSFSGRPPVPLLIWITEGYGHRCFKKTALQFH
uniref:Uncharacterized protein n=1 Tax=Sinocyclocheilus grahami TaxID=75366 RepID=A0A672R9A1_SINGR